MSSYKELTNKAKKLLNPPWYKRFIKIDYYNIADLYYQAYKQTNSKEEKIECLLQAAKCFDLADSKFDSAESFYSLYKLTNKREYLVESTNKFYKINAYSVAATKRNELVEDFFVKGKSFVKENKIQLYEDINFILNCYECADMPISSRKYFYYKGYLLFIDNKNEECKECFKMAYKNELVDFLNGKKEDFIANDWMEEEIKSKKKILLDIL